MKRLFLFITLLLVGCHNRALVFDNCKKAYGKTEDALGQLQQIRNFVVCCANNGQTNITSEQMMKQIMPKANTAADYLADAGKYLNDCIEQDDSLFKLRREIQSLEALEDRIRAIYTLCDNKYLMSISGYENEIQLMIVSLDNTAREITDTAMSIDAVLTKY